MSKNSPNAAVAEEVRAMMARKRLSQAALAERSGITASTLSRRLLDESEFTVGELYRMAAVFGIEAAQLLTFQADRVAS